MEEENDTIMRMPIVNGIPGPAERAEISTTRLNLGGSGHRGFDILDNGREFVSGLNAGATGSDTRLRVVTGLRTLVEQMDPERE